MGHVHNFVTKEGDSRLYGFEGEADYFAASICAKSIFKTQLVESKVTLPELIEKECYSNQNSDYCIRLSKASLAASLMRARILNQPIPSFLTPDPNVVSESVPNTNAQCGLDTFYAAYREKVRPACWYKSY